MSKDKWICECSAGSCDFDSEAEAREGSTHKFCGINPKITRRQLMSREARSEALLNTTTIENTDA